jgi:hypothetical protein
MNNYKKTMNKINASDTFKTKTLQLLDDEIKNERRYDMKNLKKTIVGLAACAILAVGVIGFNTSQPVAVESGVTMNLTDRMIVDPNAPAACLVANIEGVIVEVSDDGYSFKLDNGKWVDVTDETEIGITLPTALAKEDQLFEPTFRVGNSIAGFAEDENADRINAYVIYTNWNWEDPIR